MLERMKPEESPCAERNERFDPWENFPCTVAIDVTSYLASNTGVGVTVGGLVNALISASGADKLKLCAVSIKRNAASLLKKRFPHSSVCVRPFPLKLLAPMVDLSNLLKAEIIFQDADVFHAGAFLVPASKKTAIVATIHDVTPILFPRFHLPSNLYTARQLTRRCERADLVIVPSHSTRKDLEHFGIVPPQKVRVIPLAADGSFRPSLERPSKLLPDLDVDCSYLLTVGTLEPRKNLPRLFEAFRLLKDRYHIPHKLVVAGPGGWKNQDVFQGVRRLKLTDAIVLAGYVPREVLVSLYRHAAMLVYPSLYEGFGLPPLEAMASGCPVAVSSTSSLPEVVGEAGVYFNPMDVEDIAQAIYQILKSSDLRERLVNLGIMQSGKFSWRKTAEATRGVYAEAYELRQLRHVYPVL